MARPVNNCFNCQEERFDPLSHPLSQADIPSFLPEFRRISDMWLAEKSTREKGFSLGFFSEDYLRRFPAGIIRKDGKVMAFTNIWPGRGKEELSIDLMRYLPEAPRGVMECLFIQLMLWGKREGYRWFDPEWEPRYLASPHGLSLPRILANIAALISGGMKGIILK